MEIVSDNLDPSNLNLLSDTNNCENDSENQRINGNPNENVIYSLNPLLSESLNNLVKRFERTKIPKPPPSKGHSIRKKTRIHASLPNIFLPSIYDDNKYSKTEKKVQWTNKLNLDLEKMKSFFRDNYQQWCKSKQRSQSIPNLTRNVDDNVFPDSSSQNIDFICSRSKNNKNMTIKFTKCDPKSLNDNDDIELSQNKQNSINLSELNPPEITGNASNSLDYNMEIADSDDKNTYSTLTYLDGAIIEPISPASPPQSVLHNISLNESLENIQYDETPPKVEESKATPVINVTLPAKNKRGRKPKKKSQNVIAKKVKSSIINNCSLKENEIELMEAPSLELEINEPNEIVCPTIPDNIEIINLSDTLKCDSHQEIKNSPDQANDLEILSKSITNSVDTSMLPPRKRYKRLMYLENHKPTSPKDLPVIEPSQEIEIVNTDAPELDIIDIPELIVEDKVLPKLAIPRSRSKRKKKTISSVKSTNEKKTDLSLQVPLVEMNNSPELMECESVVPTKDIEKTKDDDKTEPVIKPELLKRSKREAAARGFANMVAMSLNNSNSSQSQDNSMEFKLNSSVKKSNSSRANSNDTSSEASVGKIFKRPRKSKSIEIGPSKSKVKRAVSPVVLIDDENDENDIKEKSNIESTNIKISKKTRNKNFEDISPDIKVTEKLKTFKKIKDKVIQSEISPDNINVDKPKIPHKIKEKVKLEEGSVDIILVEKPKFTRKSKEKLSEEHLLENIITEKPKGPRKTKEKMTLDENPPSPNETIISNDSLNQEKIKYRRIRTNNYIDPKPLYWFEDVERCGCKPSKMRNLLDKSEIIKSTTKGKSSKKRIGIVWDCGDNCLNRLTYTECQAKNCQCGDECNNQKIRKSEWAPGLKVHDFAGKGKGVITTKPIREGTFIMEYVGEVINEQTFQDRMVNLYRDDSHHYCLHLDGEMLIDAYRSGSIARFVNHSCQPNCEMQKWMVNGAYRMCLFAMENISADAELYYDYNFCSFNTKNTQICLCGSASCRGFIGSKPRAEQTESQKDRKKLLYIFGRLLSGREKLFILRNSIFLLRNRELGRSQRLGIRKPQVYHGNRLPSTISEIKRRKAKKNQFLTQMSALNSIRSIKTRQLQNAQDNETLTRVAQLGQVLKDLYNTLLEQKDPINSNQQLVAPFINCLNRKKYPEFYRMIGNDGIASLNQVYSRLLDGGYLTMMAFDQDILQMLHNVEFYAGKQSNIGQCAERIKPIYKELKMNSIALYEALTDEIFDEKDKQKLISNNLQLITSALAALKSHSQSTEIDLTSDSSASIHKNKKRKQVVTGINLGARGRLERGAEVIKCICGFLIEAGHVMVQCDRCFVWQHAYCMNVARSSELADVTRMEPYYCHICLNISSESLIREIPRHFVISDETIGSDNTLFWTLLKSHNLFKIDDFVYIANNCDTQITKSKHNKNSPTSSSLVMPIDLSRRTIMRIYSLWKDCNGQRWMEGGLFLRPYDSQLNCLIDKDSTKVVGTNKRKSSSSTIDINTHKWHQYEVVYTDFTKILPLDSCLGRCFVLNSYTFKHGRPLLQNNCPNNNLDVFVCDWMINQHSDWSELDPGYLKINTKAYCFERFQDTFTNEAISPNNERFTRQYLAEDLLNIDEGFQPSNEPISPKPIGRQLSDEDKISIKMQSLKKLLNKLVDFAYERNQNLPLSSTSSSASGSTSSSRGASPLCENSGGKSPLRPIIELMSHGPRKSLIPKKIVNKENNFPPNNNTITKMILNESTEPNKEVTTIASDVSDSSPQLMIVVDEFQQTPKNDTSANIDDLSKTIEKSSSTDDKDIEEKTISSVKENNDEQSNLGSEINFGDFVTLLNNETIEPPVKEKVTKNKQKNIKSNSKTSKKQTKKTKKKLTTKKNEIKPVSEITPAEDEWIPVSTVTNVSNNRPRTRSRKIASEPTNDEIEKCNESSSSNNNTEVELILTGLNIKGIFTNNDNSQIDNTTDLKLQSSHSSVTENISNDCKKLDDDDDENTKSCFVKLERMKMKQKKEKESLLSLNTKNKESSKSINSICKIDDSIVSKSKNMECLTVDVSKSLSEANTSHSVVNKIVNANAPTNLSSSKIHSKSKSQPNSSSSSLKSDYTAIQSLSHLTTSNTNKNLSDDNDNDKQESSKNPNNSSMSNRSKRKKGVPKRIPFDFSYPQINTIKPVGVSINSSTTFDDEIVDLSSCKTNVPDQTLEHCPINTQAVVDIIDKVDIHSNIVSRRTETINRPDTPSSVSIAGVSIVTEARHITAANDFSSIENISSN